MLSKDKEVYKELASQELLEEYLPIEEKAKIEKQILNMLTNILSDIENGTKDIILYGPLALDMYRTLSASSNSKEIKEINNRIKQARQLMKSE